MALQCPNCSSRLYCVDSRASEDGGVNRRYTCKLCGTITYSKEDITHSKGNRTATPSISGELVLSCSRCWDTYTTDITIDDGRIFSISNIIKEATQSGWRIGRDYYCPLCSAKLPNHCDTCEYFDRSRSVCMFDLQYTTEHDYCMKYKKGSRYNI